MVYFFLPLCFYCHYLAYRSSPSEGGCTVTALASCVIVARLTCCCHDTSTDLTPERRVYIPPHLPYIVPHTTLFVNTTQYLVPRRHVL
jgi:hypothetical protein